MKSDIQRRFFKKVQSKQSTIYNGTYISSKSSVTTAINFLTFSSVTGNFIVLPLAVTLSSRKTAFKPKKKGYAYYRRPGQQSLSFILLLQKTDCDFYIVDSKSISPQTVLLIGPL
ncbi:hypothetical protein BDF21DRAFT_402275 [Thamnidium elegans]|nr:hypothetical protein BDF21DRAFT_402275 [Thamnidium elegans]